MVHTEVSWAQIFAVAVPSILLNGKFVCSVHFMHHANGQLGLRELSARHMLECVLTWRFVPQLPRT